MLSTTAPFGSPLGGLIVHYIPSILVITIPTGDVYSFILEVEGYPGQIIALSIAVGLIWLRYKRPDLHRPYKAWLPGVLMRITVALALIAAPFFPSQAQRQKGVFGSIAYALVGISILLFGVLYWYVFAIAWPKWRGFRLEDRTETIDDGTTVTTIAHVPL
jgi:amino acid transporter